MPLNPSGLRPHHVGILQDHVLGLRFPAHAQYAGDVGVAELGEHVTLSAKLLLKLLVTRLQALHQHHGLLLLLLPQLGLGKEYVSELTLP